MPRFHGCSAPSESESVGSGTTSSGSITRWKPSPWQRSQAPWGELKEKIRGSSSGIEVPQLRQANCSLNSSVSPACAPSRISTSIRPAASPPAASTDSERRRRRSVFITSRSTTTEMSCLNFLSRTISSSSRRSSPLTLTRE